MTDPSGLRLVPITVRGPGKVTLDGSEQPTIGAAFAASTRGSIVQVGRGRYDATTESFPLRVPCGVTLRGPEPPRVPKESKKFLPQAPPAELIGVGTLIVCEADEAKLAHLKLTSLGPGPGPGDEAVLRIDHASGVSVDSCDVTGRVAVRDAANTNVAWTSVVQGPITLDASVGFALVGGSITGTRRADPLVVVTACRDVRIEAAVVTATGAGVRVWNSRTVHIGGCAIIADRDPVTVVDCERVTVNGNRLSGLQAVRVSGCVDGEVAANGIERADTAITLAACDGVVIGRNHIAGARIELLESTERLSDV